MSNKERWLSGAALLVSILPFILTAMSMQIFPEQTLGDASQIGMLPIEKKWDGKYNFLYSSLIGLIPLALTVTARVLKARKLVDKNFKYMILSSLVLGVIFLLADVYGIIYNIIINEVDLLRRFEFFEGSVVFVSLAGGMLANFFPLLKRNETMGLKNKYTMSDNRVWLKVHYAAADVYMVTLFAFALLSSVLGIWLGFRYGWIHIVLWVAAVSGLIVWGRWYSRFVARKLGVTE